MPPVIILLREQTFVALAGARHYAVEVFTVELARSRSGFIWIRYLDSLHNSPFECTYLASNAPGSLFAASFAPDRASRASWNRANARTWVN